MNGEADGSGGDGGARPPKMSEERKVKRRTEDRDRAMIQAAAMVLLGAAGLLLPSASLHGQEWAQGVHYRIEASLDEETDVLSGMAGITYTNNSPDTLEHFYVHQHLNAFRPNSLWARTDLEAGIRTFQDLGPEEHAFERIVAAFIEGVPVAPFYPNAPDSTIAGFELPEPLPPGETVTLAIRWDARLSTVPRRQGRQGRHFDFAQWYPRVVVYDDEGWRVHPLYRAGEFYGEFATYDVTLGLAEDQVVAATGVPLEGDPGWEAAAAPGTGPIDYLRDWYGSLDGPPCIELGDVRTCGIPGPAGPGPGQAEHLDFLPEAPAPGRKHVRWYAEGVHHFAWSTSPDFIYEQGAFEDVAIRVLYRPGDEAEWGSGTAVERTAVALQWMDTVFGDYAYPQVTNLHRIEPGGTEFPMLIMDGNAGLQLIVHEINHQYVHGILGNNEWLEGWLDEGASSFLTTWFFERRSGGPSPATRGLWLGSEAAVIDLELRGRAEPVVLPGEDYAEYDIYSTMVYTKGSLIFRMLRDLAGEEGMLQLLRTYYDRYQLRHVDGDAFQGVAEEVLGRDLDRFFGQWLYANGVVDYALTNVVTGSDRGADADPDPSAGGGAAGSSGGSANSFATTLTVERRGEMIMPVPVRFQGEGGETHEVVVDGGALEKTVTVETEFRPTRIELDPDGTILDWNGLNDVWSESWLRSGGIERSWIRPLGGQGAYRDRLAAGFTPLFWANGSGGAVIGLQRRTNYLGQYHRSLLRVGAPGFEALERGGASGHTDWGSLYYRVSEPIVADRPRIGATAELLAGEGRIFGRVSKEWDRSELPLSGLRKGVTAYAQVLDVYDASYLIPGRWTTEEGSAESTSVEAGVGLTRSGTDAWGRWSTRAEGGAGLSTQAESWIRGSIEAQWTGDPSGLTPKLRLFAGGATGNVSGGEWAGANVPAQRRFGVAGAGPLGELGDPWARSRDAFLEREAHHRGDGNLRGYSRELMVDAVVSLGLEIETPIVELGALELGAGVFGGLGWIRELRTVEGGTTGPDDPPTDLVVSVQENPLLADAGAGITLGWTGSPLALKVDVPFVVAHPAHARSARDDALGFRWAISVVGR